MKITRAMLKALQQREKPIGPPTPKAEFLPIIPGPGDWQKNILHALEEEERHLLVALERTQKALASIREKALELTGGGIGGTS